MTMINRYQKTLQGNLIQIGNTLGLSKANNSLTPGTLGSIGAFITTQTIAAAGWPQNTTLDYTQNSSPATLNLPAGAVVDRAELIWSASYIVPGANITANINNPISFTDPNGTVYSVTTSGANFIGISLTENGESSTNYVKSADVTTIVSGGGSGTYICGNVPATMSATANNLQYAGWSLYVAYSLSTERVRNIIIFVGNEVSVDVPYSVPINYPGPPFPIRMFYTVGEGDAIITGDQFNTRPGTGVVVVNLGTSVQPANSNPFASQITNQSGNLDTSGPFGTLNANGTTGTNVSGGRQGWDIANNVNLLPAFTGGAVANLGLDIGTNADPAIMAANGFVVDLNQPTTTLVKSVDKVTTRAGAGNTLQYTLVYTFNPNPVTTSNIVLIDTVPNGTTFIPGTVRINNVIQPVTVSPNPPGINLGTISTPRTFTVTYSVTVDTITDTTSIPNNAFGSYDFISNNTQFSSTVTSNTVVTNIDPFNATAIKNVDLRYADVGDTLVYTVTITNRGTTLNNIVFIDTIPNGTSFLSGTFKEDGTPLSVTNPSTGVNLNSMPPNSVKTITFNVLVTTIPSPNPILNSALINTVYTYTSPNDSSQSLSTNTVSTQVNNANLSTRKTVDLNYANVGDILTYTIPIANNGNVTATNITFIDTIPNGTSLVPNSFVQNGSPIVGSPNPPGASLNSIAPGATLTVVFKVKIDTIPSPNPIPNNATTQFSYEVDPITQRNVTNSTITNTVNTQVNNATLSGITKGVDKLFATCGETLTYTISIPNNGNTTANNVILSDTVPNGTVFVPNSILVNGGASSATSPASIPLGTINPGATTTVSFKVQVQC